METLTIIQAIGISSGVIASIVTAAKLTIDFVILRKTKLKQDYQFAKDFFEDICSKPTLHPFVVERGYHVISGDNSLSVKEVEYILSLENPSSSLRDYVLAKNYIECASAPEGIEIKFKNKFTTSWSRKWRKSMYMTIYIGLAILALLPTFFAPAFKSQPFTWLILLAVTVILFGIPGISSLKEFGRIYRGEKLVETQKIFAQQ